MQDNHHGNRQKDSYAIKDVVNIHRMLSRKGKETMSGPAPPGGDTEEKWGLHGLSNPPWGVSGSNHTLGFLVLGV